MIEETQPLTGSSPSVKNATMDVRAGFIRKVYALLSVQLVLTVAIAAPFQCISHKWLMANWWLMLLSVIMTIVTICAMTCCQELTRRYPTNYILLFTFTAFEGCLVGFFSVHYTWQSVLLAAGITILIFLGVTAYACFTTTDFTGMGIYFLIAIMTFCMFGLVLAVLGLFGVHIRWMMMLYDVIGVLIFSFYIIFDTQLILGEHGGHKFQFSIDDYVFAALTLYMDIIQLFMHILRLVGERK
eukprot:CAMPEP_0204578886 /NCGR_PEP_ID=MMETSP0661-20131031/43177_1 /ASSEMBLY_ACC=CAM_ASM_000606 /TAXON_ID=109239 /ORGANISM="Alexandrium margalefi, Strain AMGDE01CS-322" /LENGTH=241 /DNA_ID=CAMNT_0051587851 /DNA_START=73 /DNA_END=798 /DNA_ORIENTATION=-